MLKKIQEAESVSNNEFSTQKKLKDDAEAFRKTKQWKSVNKPPDGGEQKPLVNVKYIPFRLVVGISAEGWDDLPSSGLMFCQTSSQEFL